MPVAAHELEHDAADDVVDARDTDPPQVTMPQPTVRGSKRILLRGPASSEGRQRRRVRGMDAERRPADRRPSPSRPSPRTRRRFRRGGSTTGEGMRQRPRSLMAVSGAGDGTCERRRPGERHRRNVGAHGGSYAAGRRVSERMVRASAGRATPSALTMTWHRDCSGRLPVPHEYVSGTLLAAVHADGRRDPDDRPLAGRRASARRAPRRHHSRAARRRDARSRRGYSAHLGALPPQAGARSAQRSRVAARGVGVRPLPGFGARLPRCLRNFPTSRRTCTRTVSRTRGAWRAVRRGPGASRMRSSASDGRRGDRRRPRAARAGEQLARAHRPSDRGATEEHPRSATRDRASRRRTGAAPICSRTGCARTRRRSAARSSRCGRRAWSARYGSRWSTRSRTVSTTIAARSSAKCRDSMPSSEDALARRRGRRAGPPRSPPYRELDRQRSGRQSIRDRRDVAIRRRAA